MPQAGWTQPDGLCTEAEDGETLRTQPAPTASTDAEHCCADTQNTPHIESPVCSECAHSMPYNPYALLGRHRPSMHHRNCIHTQRPFQAQRTSHYQLLSLAGEEFVDTILHLHMRRSVSARTVVPSLPNDSPQGTSHSEITAVDRQPIDVFSARSFQAPPAGSSAWPELNSHALSGIASCAENNESERVAEGF